MNKCGARNLLSGKIMICFMVLVVLTACGNGKTAAVSMYDLRNAMLSADESFPEMLSVSDVEEEAGELFAYVSDIDYEKIEHFFISYSSEGLADEVVVVAVKNKKDIPEVKDSLEKHKDSRAKLYNQYMPAELARVEQGIVFYSGQYVVLIISDHASEVKEAFDNFVK